MSKNCIDYEEYKKIVEQQSLTPRRNLFDQNRALNLQLQKLINQNKQLQDQISHYKSVSSSIIQAIGRVFSQQLAEELSAIISTFDSSNIIQNMSQTFYQALLTHQQSQIAESQWGSSRQSYLKTPEKSAEYQQDFFSYRQSFKSSRKFSPFCHEQLRSSSRTPARSPNESIRSSIKDNDPSTNRSNNIRKSIVATSINCQICQQTFGPNQFIQHAGKCKEYQCRNEDDQFVLNLNTQQKIQIDEALKQLKDLNLEDTQDRKLKKQSQNYIKMLQNLVKIQGQIEQQIQLLRFSKEKIDRDTEKRKLQKDLAKVMFVIQEKKKELNEREKGGKKPKLGNSKKSWVKLKH